MNLELTLIHLFYFVFKAHDFMKGHECFFFDEKEINEKIFYQIHAIFSEN